MKKFFNRMFSSDKSVSSKRFFGAIGFISALILIYVVTIRIVEITDNKTHLIVMLLFVSAAMLGLEAIMNGFNFKRDEKKDK